MGGTKKLRVQRRASGENEADEDEREKNKGEIDVIACGEPPARALARSAGRWEHDSQARPAPALRKNI